MKTFAVSLSVVCLFTFAGCSGGSGGSSSNTINSSAIVTASQVETAKLQTALKAQPDYVISDSEIALLQQEGVIGDEDKTQIQAIK